MDNDQPTRAFWDVEEFILDRQSRALSPRTIQYYRYGLDLWLTFFHTQGLDDTSAVSSHTIRLFLVWLADRGHSQGGTAHVFGAVRAFLRWYGEEYAPDGWNPLQRVQAPQRPKELMPPLSLADFQAMLNEIDPSTLNGTRDRALLLVLLDTGIRKTEAHDLNVGHVDLGSGQVLIYRGKGGKGRSVFLGVKTRRALMAYFRERGALGEDAPLWVTRDGLTRLTKSGIRQAVRRLAMRAGIEEPGLHAFRRAFAVNALRNGMDLITLQRLMGHSSLEVTNRYLALVDEDLRRSHGHFSPVDNM